MVTQTDVQAWADGLDGVVDRIAPRFGRPEPRRRARAYLRGLLAPVERKNGWQLAEAVGDATPDGATPDGATLDGATPDGATPDGVQDFLSRVQWDADAVRDDLQAYVVQHLSDPDGVAILDETGFLKKGTKSAGVQRQYSGTAGRIENCQIGVFLGYASRHGQVLIDRALYLPAAWAKDDDRRREAHIPAEIAFATKPKLGLAMLERARQAEVPFAWITGDSVYGADHAIRRWAERHRRGYVLAVTSNHDLGQRPVTNWIKRLPRKAWQRLSAGDGAKGPRLYDWAYIPHSGGAPGFQCGLLVRRSIAEPTDLTFYLTHAPKDTSLAKLVQVAGLRWPIESLFEQGKGEVGLDQYEVRSWVGWHRHITLAMFALAYLAAVRKDAIGGGGPDEPRRRTVATHRARGQTPAVGAGQPEVTAAALRPALVSMATQTSATRPARPLAPTNTTHAA